jgi:hypothetical protein
MAGSVNGTAEIENGHEADRGAVGSKQEPSIGGFASFGNLLITEDCLENALCGVNVALEREVDHFTDGDLHRETSWHTLVDGAIRTLKSSDSTDA